MTQSLGQPNTEQVIWVLRMVHSQLSQHGCQPSVICSGADNAHGKNGVVRNLGVVVMRKFAECVQNFQLGVRRGEKGEGQRY